MKLYKIEFFVSTPDDWALPEENFGEFLNMDKFYKCVVGNALVLKILYDKSDAIVTYKAGRE